MNRQYDYNLNILSSEFIDQIPLIIIGVAFDGTVLCWNKRAEAVIGCGKDEANKAGIPLFSRILRFDASETSQIDRTGIVAAISSGKIQLREKNVMVRSKQGEIHHVRWNSYPITKTSQNLPSIIVIAGTELTQMRALQQKIVEKDGYINSVTNRLRKYISLDPHTGLLNYRHFIQKLNSCFYRAFENDMPLSLLIVDIDYFCSINTLYGARRGNRILRALAVILKNNTDESFSVARLSGTEFAVLMPDVDIRSAFNFSGEIYDLIADHNFGSQEKDMSITLSLHMALGGYPHCEDVFTPEQLLNNVTDKLREAKRIGANSILICSSNEDRHRKGSVKGVIPIDNKEYRYTLEFVNALANTVKTKDLYTLEHSASMSGYAVSMADYFGMPSADIQNIKYGAILHDIGKIGVDKTILQKPGALNDSEFEIIKQHPRIGAEIIRNVHPLRKIVPLVLYHHERYDGSGYLGGLRGEEIPLGARIISLADVYQALTSDRPYRRSLPDADAISVIRSYSGKFFDPKVVKAFFEVYKSSV